MPVFTARVALGSGTGGVPAPERLTERKVLPKPSDELESQGLGTFAGGTGICSFQYDVRHLPDRVYCRGEEAHGAWRGWRRRGSGRRRPLREPGELESLELGLARSPADLEPQREVDGAREAARSVSTIGLCTCTEAQGLWIEGESLPPLDNSFGGIGRSPPDEIPFQTSGLIIGATYELEVGLSNGVASDPATVGGDVFFYEADYRNDTEILFTTPEPSTGFLLGFGLLALAASRSARPRHPVRR